MQDSLTTVANQSQGLLNLLTDKDVLLGIMALVGVIIGALFNNKFATYTRPFIKILENEREVNVLLGQFRKRYSHLGFERVEVYHYHNGGKFYSGHPRQKASMTHEICSDKVKSLYKDHQDLPISYFSDVAWWLQTNSHVKDVNLPKTDKEIKNFDFGTYRRLLIERGVMSHYAFAVYKDIYFFRWHPVFIVKEKRMVASIHINFVQEVDLKKSDEIWNESQIHQIEKLIV